MDTLATLAPFPGAELDIRDTLRNLVRAWDRHDPAAYAAHFTPDADYVVFDGSRLQGREAIAAFYRQRFATVLSGSRLRLEEIEVRFARQDLALVSTESCLRQPWDDELAPARAARQTLTMVYARGEWRIAAFHSCRIRRTGPLPDWRLRLSARWHRLRCFLSGAETGPLPQ